MAAAQDIVIQILRFLTSSRVFFVSLTLGILLIFASPVILVTYVFWDFDVSSDPPVIEKVEISPDARFTARHFIISGGGAAGYVFESVNIQQSTDNFDKSKGIILQTTHTAINSLKWRENNLLVVEYSKEGNVYLKKEAIDDQINAKILFIEK
jgi:hypothetical protein